MTPNTPEPVRRMVEEMIVRFVKTFSARDVIHGHDEMTQPYPDVRDWLHTHATTLVNDAVREGVKAEREKWATRLPEDTVQVTVEARVGSNVLANRKFAHVESIQLSSGTVLHTVASEAVSEILHEIIHPHPTHR